MTARRIIAEGCIHLPKGSEPRPLAASVRVVRAVHHAREAVDRPLADTSSLRWSSQGG